MSKFRFSILLVCIILSAILSGCHKPEGLKTQSTYTFTNQTGKQITFDVYRTKEDYNQNQNRLQQYIIEPNASQPLVLDVATAYWVDWYSAGYSFNNWQSERSSYNRSSPPPEVNIAAEDETFFITAVVVDTARSVFLNGSGTSSRWRCTITDNDQLNGTHEFIFNKDFSGTYIYTSTGGSSTQIPMEYFINSSMTRLGISQGFNAYIMSPQGQLMFQLTCNTGYFLNPHTGRDTMMIRSQQVSSSTDYPLVRQ